jgi:two-component system, OmpR family, response regulator MprA
MRVLVVDDHADTRKLLVRSLERASYGVKAAASCADAEAAVGHGEFDVVVLDVMLPDGSGIDLCGRLRAGKLRTPILLLTARGEVRDRVAGLDAGADDYLVKPFALRELQARLRALLRRAEEPGGPVLSYADLVLAPSAREVRRGERPIELSRTEFSLLQLFLEHPRQVLTRSQLFERVWGYDFGATSNALGVYIGYLRRKTEAAGEPRLLHTVRGIGYVLREG